MVTMPLSTSVLKESSVGYQIPFPEVPLRDISMVPSIGAIVLSVRVNEPALLYSGLT